MTSNFLDPRLSARFWSKCTPEPNSGCWLWFGARSDQGYGVIRIDWELRYAHRLAYERLVGAIPHALDIDHRCRNRACCNPAHLEPVTRAVNLARSPLTAHARKSWTHCKRGHEFTEANTLTRPASQGRNGTRRMCRLCQAMRRDKFKASRTSDYE